MQSSCLYRDDCCLSSCEKQGKAGIFEEVSVHQAMNTSRRCQLSTSGSG